MALLGPLNLSSAQTAALVKEGDKEAWKDEKLRAALEKQLGKNVSIYVNLIRSIHRGIEKLAKKLKLRSTLEVSKTP